VFLQRVCVRPARGRACPRKFNKLRRGCHGAPRADASCSGCAYYTILCACVRLDCAWGVCVCVRARVCVCVKAREALVGWRRRTTAAISSAFILLLFQEETVPAYMSGKWFQAAFPRRTPKNVLDRSPRLMLYCTRIIIIYNIINWRIPYAIYYVNVYT